MRIFENDDRFGPGRDRAALPKLQRHFRAGALAHFASQSRRRFHLGDAYQLITGPREDHSRAPLAERANFRRRCLDFLQRARFEVDGNFKGWIGRIIRFQHDESPLRAQVSGQFLHQNFVIGRCGLAKADPNSGQIAFRRFHFNAGRTAVLEGELARGATGAAKRQNRWLANDITHQFRLGPKFHLLHLCPFAVVSRHLPGNGALRLRQGADARREIYGLAGRDPFFADLGLNAVASRLNLRDFQRLVAWVVPFPGGRT